MARTTPHKPRERQRNPQPRDPLTKAIRVHERKFKKNLKKLKDRRASAEAQIKKRSKDIARQPIAPRQQTDTFEKQIAGYEATLETAKVLEVTSAAAIERLEIIVQAQAEKLEELEARLAAKDQDLSPQTANDDNKPLLSQAHNTDDVDATFGTDPWDTWTKKVDSKDTMNFEQIGREIELVYRGAQDKT